AVGMFGGWLAALAGAWFAVGPILATLWNVQGVGAPLGAGDGRHVAEQLAGFTGLGVVIVFLAALALGRFAVVGVREQRLNEPEPPGSNSTQPLVYGRYARENQRGQDPPPTGDQHVAGDTRWER
ncbi:MAG: hypothetical protein HOU01_24510, partial [Streptomycetaceae bacterium]|nr:hypothetical protein [Streptomycetaceae bacterium]